MDLPWPNPAEILFGEHLVGHSVMLDLTDPLWSDPPGRLLVCSSSLVALRWVGHLLPIAASGRKWARRERCVSHI